MEIILLEKVQNLGDLGETVQVANGYARNFLIPQKKAMRATEAAKAVVVERRRQLAQEESKRVEVAQARADLTPREITLTRLAGEGGKLYGSVSPVDIAEGLSEGELTIEKSEVIQPDGPIKQIGEHTAEVNFHPEVRFEVKITVLEGDGSMEMDFDEASLETSLDASAESDAPSSEFPQAEDAQSEE